MLFPDSRTNPCPRADSELFPSTKRFAAATQLINAHSDAVSKMLLGRVLEGLPKKVRTGPRAVVARLQPT